MSTRPAPPAQKGLWGRQEPLRAPRAPWSSTNDMDLFMSIVKAAQDPGYVLIGPAGRVVLRDPARKGQVQPVPKYEADTVAQLLDAGHLKIGGTHHVHYGDRDGAAHAVLVPKTTAARIARWSNLRPIKAGPPATPDAPAAPACSACGDTGGIPINRQTRWTPDKGVHRPTGTTPCPRCQPRELWCPECGEPAIARPPTRWTAANGPRPEHSHPDGEPLCPVVTATGYRPARPTTRRHS